MSYPDTHYSRTRADRTDRPMLSGRVEADCIIVGGGLAGLTTALELARAGRAVVVLEAESVAFGASGRNGGLCSPAYACGADKIAARVGPEAARALHRMSIEGMDIVAANIKALKIASADPCAGVLRAKRTPQDTDLQAQAAASLRDYDYPLEYLSRDALRARLNTARYFHALRDPRGFHLHPLNYARGLAAEIERLGGQIFEGAAVTACGLDRPTKSADTAHGRAEAPQIVVTTGGYTGPLVPRLRRTMMPIATYMMVSEPAPELIATAITTSDAVTDNRRAGDYYRLVEGGKRLLWGGRITTRAASVEGLVRELRREIVTTYPQLAELKTDVAWSGQMAYARHLMPQIGQMQQGVWHATSFGGHGLNTTAIGGKLVAEGILGETDRYRAFAPFGLDWAGGAVGLGVAQATYWWLQARDWWTERRV